MEWFELWLCALVLTFGLLFSTGQKNGYAHIEEDIYLPQHYCKSTKLFYIIFKQEYLRFSIFWQRIIIGASFLLYSITILIANVVAYMFQITYSSIVHNILVFSIFIIPISSMICEGIVWLYVLYRKNKDNIDRYTYK